MVTDYDVLPAASVLADWIEGRPDDSLEERIVRANRYRRDALVPPRLAALLAEASAHLVLDGRPVAAGPADWRFLTAERPRRWEQRMLLCAAVLHILNQRCAFDRSGISPSESSRLDRLTEELFKWSGIAPSRLGSGPTSSAGGAF
ncbi:hypothetical protein [Streptomyces sp. NPDC056672]|uniref:hypothetical protein n=1 Tax=Streptomyces sp. NPDC056672 TaxID=3345906 RepID=UPI0036926EEE